MTTTYRPGPGSGLVGQDLWCLVDTVPGEPLSLEVLGPLSLGDPARVLQMLDMAGVGYALAARDGGGAWSVSANGTGRALIRSADGFETVEDGQVSVHDPLSLTLVVGADPGGPVPPIPLATGLVPASAVHVALRTAEKAAESHGAAPKDLAETATPALDERPQAGLSASPWALDDFSDYDRFGQDVELPALEETPGALDVPEVHEADMAPVVTTRDEASLTPPPSGPSETPNVGAGNAGWAASMPARPVEVPNPGVEVAPPPAGPLFVDAIPFDLDDAPRASGGPSSSSPATFPRSEPVPAPAFTAVTSNGPVAAPPTPPPRSEPHVEAEAVAPGVPEQQVAAAFAVTVPTMPDAPEAVDSGGNRMAGDIGHTVHRSVTLGSPPPQQVWAVLCPSGHNTPPHLPWCRVCRQPIAQGTQSRPVVRPVLGRVVLPTGQSFPLDRGLVLGRAPRVPEDFVGERPHVVKVVDPRSEVSSQHVLLSLDYWNVLVTDLGSTNGTELVLPDGRRQRLVAHSPVVIEAGTRIVLAEILELTFEATA